jgi:Skp family chaperone for outer membrane proteins
MKMFRNLIYGFVFVLAFAFLAIAQTEKTQTTAQPKIALIFPEIFEDEKKGIRDLIEVNKKLDVEFKTESDELKTLADKVVNLEKELRQLASISEKKNIEYPPNIISEYKAKADKYKELSDEFNKKQSAAKALYDKRKAESTVDINKKIGEAVKQFAKEKGYDMILDATKLNNCYPSWCDTSLDVTQDFIKYYNENFGNTKSQ